MHGRKNNKYGKNMWVDTYTCDEFFMRIIRIGGVCARKTRIKYSYIYHGAYVCFAR